MMKGLKGILQNQRGKTVLGILLGRSLFRFYTGKFEASAKSESNQSTKGCQ
jgi:hypothetical protein